MPTVSVYNEQGQRVGEIALSEAVFQVKPDPALIHEVTLAQRANARRAIASTKTKGEVRGGGKKPWRQKGTGRARQGSIRSPQWIGGGITFGPTSERNFSVKVNKKTKRKALFMALSDKVAHEKMFVLESLSTTPTKTKHAVTILGKLPLEKKVLLVAPASTPLLMRMVRNLPSVNLVTANSLNLTDVLSARSLVFLKEAVPVLEGLYQTSSV